MTELSATIPSHLMADPKADFPKAKNAMGKDDFMKLLMTQLQNQDPMKPMDHHEFAAQLAQFGSLEQLTNIHKGIEGLHTGMGDEAKLSALSMIGKKVQALGNQVELMEGQSVSLKYASKDGLQPVKAAIYTDGGKLVREIEISKAEGSEIKWDGKDQEGHGLPTGKYTFRVQGVDKNGTSSELSTELSGRVSGVEIDGKTPTLIVETSSGKTRMELTKVKQVFVEPEKLIDPLAKPTTAVAPPVSKPVLSPEQMAAQVEEGSNEESLPSVADLDKGIWSAFPGVAGMEGMR